ncbi:Uncharacterized protein FWK35_00034795, partial [Aphis craccivora]
MFLPPPPESNARAATMMKFNMIWNWMRLKLGSTTTTINSIQKTHGHDYSVPSWINRLSYGGLIIPINDFKIKIFRVEKLYRKITKQQIPKGPGVVKKLTKNFLSRMEIAKKYNLVVQTYIKQ